jgi:hypothetical protein
MAVWDVPIAMPLTLSPHRGETVMAVNTEISTVPLELVALAVEALDPEMAEEGLSGDLSIFRSTALYGLSAGSNASLLHRLLPHASITPSCVRMTVQSVPQWTDCVTCGDGTITC